MTYSQANQIEAILFEDLGGFWSMTSMNRPLGDNITFHSPHLAFHVPSLSDKRIVLFHHLGRTVDTNDLPKVRSQRLFPYVSVNVPPFLDHGLWKHYTQLR